MDDKTALITGITGQDGSYLAELLLAKGYVVHGMVRRGSLFTTGRLDHLFEDPHRKAARLRLHFGDLCDSSSIRKILEETQPREIYNLAAQSHVKVSFEIPEYTADTVALGTLRLLEALRDYAKTHNRDVRFYQAGSSEMFGQAPAPQSIHTPFEPRSPYAAAKVAAHWFARNYREAYGLYICNGILFNHESPRRGETFVTRKITRAIGRIKCGLQDRLYLGNLQARRDWGFAGDYVEATWRMLQQPAPGDYVVATGISHSVREFLDAAFSYANLDWHRYVSVDESYLRPTEVDNLVGDAAETQRILGWRPTVTFDGLVRMMVDADHELARREQTLLAAGHRATAGPNWGLAT
ncbi:MAG: GDP-mannose 4,6-dehydratase [Thermoplasmatota archaeon]